MVHPLGPMVSLVFLSLCALLVQAPLAAAQNPRNVHVSLAANWNATSILCEAAEFHARVSSSAFWRFIEGVLGLDPLRSLQTDRDEYETALQLSQSLTLLGPVALRALRFSLGIHHYSPRCEMMRQLRVSHLASRELNSVSVGDAACPVLVFALGRSACGAVAALGLVQEALEAREQEHTQSSGREGGPSELEAAFEFDHQLFQERNRSFVPTVVVYGAMQTGAQRQQLLRIHRELAVHAASGHVRYVLRPVLSSNHQSPLSLQGFGVELAIKNMEYKVIDDSKVESGTELLDGDLDLNLERQRDVSGFYFQRLMERRPDLTDKLQSFKESLLTAGPDEGLEKVKVWDLKDLGIQSAQQVMRSSDPLRLLQDLAQNFPMYANTLVRVHVNASVKEEIVHNQQFMEAGANMLQLNGISLRAEEVDVFELQQLLQIESLCIDRLLDGGEQLSPDVLRQLLRVAPSYPTSTQQLRLDMRTNADAQGGKNGVIHWINDLEDSKHFRQGWSHTVNELLTPAWPNQLRYIQKNLHTGVLVLDPVSKSSLDVYSKARFFVKANAPIRIGFVFNVRADSASDVRTSSDPAGKVAWDSELLEGPQWNEIKRAVGADEGHDERHATTKGEKKDTDDEDEDGDGDGDGGEEGDKEGGDQEPLDPVMRSLGAKIARLFHYLYRKRDETALQFLDDLHEATQKAPLTEARVKELWLRRAPRKASKGEKLDREELWAKVAKTSKVYEGLVRRSVEFLSMKGLYTPRIADSARQQEAVHFIINGVQRRTTVETFRDVMMEGILTEQRILTMAVYRQQLTDADDLDLYFSSLPSAVPRISESVLHSLRRSLPPSRRNVEGGTQEAISVSSLSARSSVVVPLPLEPQFRDALSFISRSDLTSGSDGAAAAAAAVSAASYIVALDPDSALGAALLRAAERHLARADGSKESLDADDVPELNPRMLIIPNPQAPVVSAAGVLPLPSEDDIGVLEQHLSQRGDSGGLLMLRSLLYAAGEWASGHVFGHSASASEEPMGVREAGARLLRRLAWLVHVLPRHLRLRALLLLWKQTLQEEASDGALSRLLPAEASSKGALAWLLEKQQESLEGQQSVLSNLHLAPGATAIASTWGVWQIPTDYTPLASLECDLVLLDHMAAKFGKALDIARILFSNDGDGNGVVGATRSDTLARVTLALLNRANRISDADVGNVGGGLGESETVFDSLQHRFSRVDLSAPGALIHVDAVLDPLSHAAQRFVPILRAVHEVMGISLSLYLNPRVDLSELPLNRFYRYALWPELEFEELGAAVQSPGALFRNIRSRNVLTMGTETPESWLVMSQMALNDLDNIVLDDVGGSGGTMRVVYKLEHLLMAGRAYDVVRREPPAGLKLFLGAVGNPHECDTVVMQNLGYFQLKAAPGLWKVQLAPEHASVYRILDDFDENGNGGELPEEDANELSGVSRLFAVSSFSDPWVRLWLRRRKGQESAKLESVASSEGGLLSRVSGYFSGASKGEDETIHIFSVASGHLYERFLKIMMLSVTKNTKSPVKFWFIKNFLSPQFKEFVPKMAKHYGFEVELATYKWPLWLRRQTQKQRIIWGYKILFLDVLFPLSLKRVIFVDADQLVRGDMKELWNMDLRGAPYAYTPFCGSNKDTEGFRFWKSGYWKDHLRGKPYHISALYVVDLEKFRHMRAGDTLRMIYDQLSADPNSLSNLDQDLPNYAQHMVPIHSLPQQWLWCETWCSLDTLKDAKTIDLCNNPLTKEPKLDVARRLLPEWNVDDREARELTLKFESEAQQSQQQRTNNEAQLEALRQAQQLVI